MSGTKKEYHHKHVLSKKNLSILIKEVAPNVSATDTFRIAFQACMDVFAATQLHKDNCQLEVFPRKQLVTPLIKASRLKSFVPSKSAERCARVCDTRAASLMGSCLLAMNHAGRTTLMDKDLEVVLYICSDAQVCRLVDKLQLHLC